MQKIDRDPTFAGWARSEAFAASAAPYLVLDRQLHIRAVNPAYEKATLQPREKLLDQYLFDAFPDNPATPEACSVTNLARSLETVFRRKQNNRMALQRYDVPAPTGHGRFVAKVWRPTNSPLRDDRGAVVGVLHHVEDVTDAVASCQLPAAAPQQVDPSTEQLLAALSDLQTMNAQLLEVQENLQTALRSSRTIGTAIGIVMFSHKVTADDAFQLLRTRSQVTHRKLRELAEDVIEQGRIDV